MSEKIVSEMHVGDVRNPVRTSSLGPSADAIQVDLGIRLTPVHQGREVDSIDLIPGQYTFGSAEDCQVVVPIDGIAPRHCTFIVGNHRSIIKALSNRTWVNDGLAVEAALRHGDRLVIGPIEYTVGPITQAVEEHDFSVPHAFTPDSRFESRVEPPMPRNDAQLIRREAQLNELLEVIQGHLDTALQQERGLREEFSKERMSIQHRARELDFQWKEFETKRHIDAKLRESLQKNSHDIEVRKKQLTAYEQELSERHAELADRSAALNQFFRQLKGRDEELSTLEQVLEGEKRDSARLLEERHASQDQLLRSRESELEEKRLELESNFASVQQQQQELQLLQSEIEQSQAEWAEACKAKETLIRDLESKASQRMQQVEEEEERLSHWSRRVTEADAIATDKLQLLDARSLAVEQAGQQVDIQLATIKEKRHEIDLELERLHAAHNETEQKLFEIQQFEDYAAEARRSISESNALLSERARGLDLREHNVNRLQAEVQKHEAAVAAEEALVEERLQLARITANLLDERNVALEQRERHLAESELGLHSREVAVIAREMDLEEIQAAIHRREAELSLKYRDFSQSLEAMQAERLSLNGSQTEFNLFASDKQSQLDAFSQNLEQEKAAFEEQRAQLSQEMEEVRHLQAELNEGRVRLQLEQEHLNNYAAEMAPLRANIDAEQLQLTAETERLKRLQVELDQLRAAFDSERNLLEEEKTRFYQLQADHDNEKRTLEHQLGVLNDQTASLQADSASFRIEQEQWQQACKEFGTDSQALQQLRDEIAAEQALLTAEKERFAERQIELDRSKQSLDEQLAELDAQRAQIHAETDAVRDEREKLESSRADYDAELQNLNRLRGEIEAERQRDAYDREQLRTSQALFYSQEESLRAKQLELQGEAETLSQMRQEVEFAQHGLKHLASQTHETVDRRNDSHEIAEELASLRIKYESLLADAEERKRQDEFERASNEQKLKQREENWEAKVASVNSAIKADRDELEALRALIEDQQTNLMTSSTSAVPDSVHPDQDQINERQLALEALEARLLAENERLHEIATNLKSRALELERREVELSEFNIDSSNMFNDRNLSVFGTSHAGELRSDSQIAEDVAAADEISEVIRQELASDKRVEAGELPTDRAEIESTDSEEEAAIKLRQQLASLFGMNTDTSEPAEESRAARRRRLQAEREEADRISAEAAEDVAPSVEEEVRQEVDKQVEESSIVQETVVERRRSRAVEPTPQPEPALSRSTEDEGEISVADYMERLIARSRQGGNPSSSAASTDAAPKQNVRPAPVTQPPAEVEVGEEVIARRTRKLDESEKQALRVNLDSFRKLANQSARTAVVTSTCEKKSTSLKTMLTINALGWAMTGILLTSEFWYGERLLIEAASVGSVSLFLSCLCIYRMKEIRRLQHRSAAELRLDAVIEQTPRVEEQANGSEKSGPLSFL
ncbi:FHA domain-containing protein [Planctomicrobium sp. SH668]|uniref:FHA domain-containing protein n=1 Tax=Planctomicrobium sp. SH668 TaxID=3448126 RepID=UPI003F5C36D5